MTGQQSVMERLETIPFDPIAMAGDSSRATLPEMIEPTTDLIAKTYVSMRENSREIALAAGLAGTALFSVGAALTVGAQEAKAATTDQAVVGEPQITSQTTIVRIGSQSVNADALSTSKGGAEGKVTILSNILTKGTPKAVVRKAERNGKCVTRSGEKNVIHTEGWNVNGGREFGRDYRTSRFCFINGHWVRVKCGNRAFINVPTPRPPVKGKVLWVSNMNKAVLSVKASAHAKAEAKCDLPGASASAIGEGSGSASANVRFKALARGKFGASNVRNFVNSYRSSATLEANADATADASAKANCSTTPPGDIPPPKERVNNPPTVDLVSPEHMFVNGTVEICAYGNDPDGQSDIASRSMTESGKGSFVSDIRSGDEPGEFCRDFFAGTSAGEAVITATVTDKAGKSSSPDTERFPILDDSNGGPGSF